MKPCLKSKSKILLCGVLFCLLKVCSNCSAMQPNSTPPKISDIQWQVSLIDMVRANPVEFANKSQSERIKSVCNVIGIDVSSYNLEHNLDSVIAQISSFNNPGKSAFARVAVIYFLFPEELRPVEIFDKIISLIASVNPAITLSIEVSQMIKPNSADPLSVKVYAVLTGTKVNDMRAKLQHDGY